MLTVHSFILYFFILETMPYRKPLVFNNFNEVKTIVETIIVYLKKLFKFKWPNFNNIDDYTADDIHWSNAFNSDNENLNMLMNEVLGHIICYNQNHAMSNIGLEFTRRGKERKIFMNTKFQSVYFNIEVENSIVAQWIDIIVTTTKLNNTSTLELADSTDMTTNQVIPDSSEELIRPKRKKCLEVPTSITKPIEDLKKSRRCEISKLFKNILKQLMPNCKEEDLYKDDLLDNDQNIVHNIDIVNDFDDSDCESRDEHVQNDEHFYSDGPESDYDNEDSTL